MIPKLRFEIISLFPKFFESPIQESIIGRAIKKRIIEINLHNIRDHAKDSRGTVDDRPYGGGEGMVLKIDTLVDTLEDLNNREKFYVVLLDPKGKKFNQKQAEILSNKKRIVLVCGHYEGVDQRFADNWADEVLSIGDYILSGGESGALVLIDSITRLLPGALGNKKSAEKESFSQIKTIEGKSERILDYPVYTRPEVFRGKKVPSVLLSGDHSKIETWRKTKSLDTTKKVRSDLL